MSATPFSACCLSPLNKDSPPRYAIPERRTKFADRAPLLADDARTTGVVILRLTTRKASDATDIVLSSSLCGRQLYNSSSRLNMANSASGTSWANFSGSVSSRVFSTISSQDPNSMSLIGYERKGAVISELFAFRQSQDEDAHHKCAI